VTDLADMLARWIRTVCGGPVVLFGHSTGGQVALRVAAQAPELVSTLVLGGPTFPPSQRTLPGLAAAFLRNSRHEPSGLGRVTVPYYRRGGAKDVLRLVRSGQQDTPERTIRDVHCPVTVLRGVNDAFSPQKWAASLADSAPDGRLVIMPGAHTFPYRQGGLTAARIAEAERAGSSG
jgi:pimeloyl-ACP methyl ester carboxylesterase